jgi:hypothetical protein
MALEQKGLLYRGQLGASQQGESPTKEKSLLSSMDSGLEAFSRNPADDSFASLPLQADARAIVGV